MVDQWTEVDQEDTVRETLEDSAGHVRSEPGLPDAAGSGEGQHACRRQQILELGDLPCPADERRSFRRDVRGARIQGAQRRELRRHALDQQVAQPERLWEVLQPMRTEIAQRDAVGQIVFDQASGRRR